MKRDHEIVVLSKGAYARTVRIYSPKKATRAIITHDGQTAFEKNGVFDILKRRVKNIALIAIDGAPSRLDDYFPYRTQKTEYSDNAFGGYAEKYREYVMQTVIPYLDKRFGYAEYAMLGYAAGAAATLFFADSAHSHPRVTAYGIFCAPLFVAPDEFSRFLTGTRFADASYRIYTDKTNFREQTITAPDALYSASAVSIAAALQRCGVNKISLEINNDEQTDVTELQRHSLAVEFATEFANAKYRSSTRV